MAFPFSMFNIAYLIMGFKHFLFCVSPFFLATDFIPKIINTKTPLCFIICGDVIITFIGGGVSI